MAKKDDELDEEKKTPEKKRKETEGRRKSG